MAHPLHSSSDNSPTVYIEDIPLRTASFDNRRLDLHSDSDEHSLSTTQAHKSSCTARRALLSLTATGMLTGAVLSLYGAQKVDSLVSTSNATEQNLAEACLDIVGIVSFAASIVFCYLSCKKTETPAPLSIETPSSHLI